MGGVSNFTSRPSISAQKGMFVRICTYYAFPPLNNGKCGLNGAIVSTEPRTMGDIKSRRSQLISPIASSPATCRSSAPPRVKHASCCTTLCCLTHKPHRSPLNKPHQWTTLQTFCPPTTSQHFPPRRQAATPQISLSTPTVSHTTMAVSASSHSALLTRYIFTAAQRVANTHCIFLARFSIISDFFFPFDSCRLATFRSFNQLFFRVCVLIMVSSPLNDFSYRLSDWPLSCRLLFHFRSHCTFSSIPALPPSVLIVMNPHLYGI